MISLRINKPFGLWSEGYLTLRIFVMFVFKVPIVQLCPRGELCIGTFYI